MAYNPAIHSTTNKAVGVAQNAPTDARQKFFDPSIPIYRDYQSVAEANGYLTVSKMRGGNFSLFMNTTGTLNGDGTFTGGETTEYWYKDGVTDGDLILKTNGDSGGGSFIGTLG